MSSPQPSPATYDEWKTTQPDPGLYDDPPEEDSCPDCGAVGDEPCDSGAHDEILMALKALLAATPDCEGNYLVDSKGNYLAKAVGLGAACKAARAVIAKAEPRQK